MLKCNFIMQPGKSSALLLEGHFVMFIRFVEKALYGVYEIAHKFVDL